MKSPPAGVKLVLEAVCIMKNIKPVRVKDANSGRMVDDYWEASKKMLMEVSPGSDTCDCCCDMWTGTCSGSCLILVLSQLMFSPEIMLG